MHTLLPAASPIQRHSMTRILRRLFVAALLYFNVSGGIAATESPDLSHAWFEPMLTTKSDAICPDALAGAKKKFVSRAPWIEPFDDVLGSQDSGQAGALQLVRWDDLERAPVSDADLRTGNRTAASRENVIMTSGGMQLYVRLFRRIGCGGACDSHRLVVSDQALPDVLPEVATSQFQFASSPHAVSWSIYRASESYYAVGIVEGQLQVYRITHPRVWALSCEIELVPPNVRESSDAATRQAVRSLEALENAVNDVGGGAGNCGSANTDGRWRSYFHQALTQVLFRPWAAGAHEQSKYESENSYGDYDRNFDHLTNWSLTGVWERRAFAAYNAQLAATTQQLAEFYKSRYRWSDVESQRMAQSALKAAISTRFGFYMYEPFITQVQRDLMQAVLEHRPMSEIKSIPVSFATESLDEQALLSVAVTHPEALRYLLENGADPNKGNAFGKTPLMYAAQYNEKLSAEILLQHQADPNATTTIPNDTCNYDLQTTSMTPLHYAVRYGSASLVRALVKYGAVAFIKTRMSDHPDSYAIDWLRKYTADDAPERNTNLSDADVKELELLLRVPDTDERRRISIQLTQVAESEYAAGRAERAYQALRTALKAQESNVKAMEDLPLIALRAGHFGPSLEAADALIAGNLNRASSARAWFNKGLACQQAGEGHFLGYNGRYYCQESRLHPFLVSWKLEATAARKNKLVELFADGSLPSCSIDGGRSKIHFDYADDEDDFRYAPRQMIYVYHSSARPFDADSMHWTASLYDAASNARTLATQSPTLVASHDLGDATITVLMSPAQIQWPVSVGTEKCDAPASAR